MPEQTPKSVRNGGLWFVMPAHGRHRLAAICMRQLRRTLDRLDEIGIRSYAVVVADEDEHLEVAEALGFDTLVLPNDPLGAKWNAGYQHAGLTRGASWIVPIGSDDVVDADVFAAALPAPGEISCFRTCSLVSPDGGSIVTLEITYDGGDGIKIFSRDSLEPIAFAPAADGKSRAIDGSITRRMGARAYVYRDSHPLQILEMKSDGEQLNDYAGSVKHWAPSPPRRDPLRQIRRVYPDLARELEAMYRDRTAVAA